MARNNRSDFSDDFNDFSGSSRERSSGGSRGRSGDFDDWRDKNPMDDVEEPKGVFNVAMLLISIVLAPIVWTVSMFMYESLVDAFPRVLLIGLIFLLLGLSVGLVVHMTSKLGRTFQRNLSPARGAIPVVATIVLASFLMGGLSMGFQFLYQSRFHLGEKASSYIFIIDNSGSMDNNDPHMERYEAITQVLEEMDDDFPFMVYGFDDNAYMIREMEPVSEGIDLGNIPNGGLTYMKEALELVISDYENDLWDGGKNPQVVLLTDGIANDFSQIEDLEDILEEYVDNNITISTVGLINSDPKMMGEIARRTGGVFVEIDDASKLVSALTDAVNNKTDDDLLNTRESGDMDLLMGALRVLFIILLGALLSYIKAVAYGQGRAYKAVILSGAAQALVGALIMELGTSLLGFDALFCWMLLWTVLILTICNKYERGVDMKKKHRVGGDF